MPGPVHQVIWNCANPALNTYRPLRREYADNVMLEYPPDLISSMHSMRGRFEAASQNLLYNFITISMYRYAASTVFFMW